MAPATNQHHPRAIEVASLQECNYLQSQLLPLHTRRSKRCDYDRIRVACRAILSSPSCRNMELHASQIATLLSVFVSVFVYSGNHISDIIPPHESPEDTRRDVY